jgi:hypothetical protein
MNEFNNEKIYFGLKSLNFTVSYWKGNIIDPLETW